MSMGAKWGFCCSTVHIFTPYYAHRNQRLADPKSEEDNSLSAEIANQDFARATNQRTRGPFDDALPTPCLLKFGCQ